MREKKKISSLVVSMGAWLVLFDVLLLGGNAMEGYRDVLFGLFLGGTCEALLFGLLLTARNVCAIFFD